MASEQAKQLATKIIQIIADDEKAGRHPAEGKSFGPRHLRDKFASLIDDAYECTCTERDALKAALRELHRYAKKAIQGHYAYHGGIDAVAAAESLLTPLNLFGGVVTLAAVVWGLMLFDAFAN